MELRTCQGACGRQLPLEHFAKHKPAPSEARRKRCRDCHRTYQRENARSVRRKVQITGEEVPRVPIAPIRSYILEKLAEFGDKPSLGRAVGLDESHIGKLISVGCQSSQQKTSLDNVDSILTAFGDAWLLPEMYPEVFRFYHDDLLDSLVEPMIGHEWYGRFIPTRATERAVKRAVQDLVTGGWVSAERLNPVHVRYTRVRHDSFDATELIPDG